MGIIRLRMQSHPTSASGAAVEAGPPGAIDTPRRALRWLGRGLIALVGLIALGGAMPAPDRSQIAPLATRCHAPLELARFAEPLRQTARRLAHDHRLSIVAIGSSSTVGFGAGPPPPPHPGTPGRAPAPPSPQATIRGVNRAAQAGGKCPS